MVCDVVCDVEMWLNVCVVDCVWVCVMIVLDGLCDVCDCCVMMCV